MRLLAIAVWTGTVALIVAGVVPAIRAVAPTSPDPGTADLGGGRQDRPTIAALDDGFTFDAEPEPAPPRVLAVEPTDGSTAVSVSEWIVVLFSTGMNRSATESGLSFTDGVRTMGPANGTFTWSGQTVPDDRLAFNPEENLRTSATLSVRLNATAVLDRGGLPLDGNGNGVAEGSPVDDYLWDFTVEDLDATPPQVRGTDPPDAATDVPITASIVITFAEAMNTSGVMAGLSYTDGTSSFSAANGTGSWMLAREVLAFTPAQSLAYGVAYFVTVNGSAARDLAGNPLDGDGNGAGGDNYSFSFLTAANPDTTPPDILATIPADGDTRIGIQPVITIVFTEGMNRPSVHAALVMTSGVTLTGISWPSENIVLFTPESALAYTTPYTVTVLSTARDVAGNHLTSARSFRFTTTPWSGAVTGSVVDEDHEPISGATVQLGGQETLTAESGAYAFPRVEQGTYPLTITKSGYRTFAESVAINETYHEIGTTVLRELAADSGPLPWIVVALVATSAAVLVFLLRRRPKFEPSPYHWRPSEAVPVTPEEDRSEP